MVRRTLNALSHYGINPIQSARMAALTPGFFAEYFEFRRLSSEAGVPFPMGKLYPCLLDRHDASGAATGHYFHQDLLVAQRLFEASPTLHADIGSRVDGFVAHVAAFRKIVVFDIREQTSRVRNVEFHVADFMGVIEPCYHDYCDSLSCLHTLEHFGLGRYGDPLCADGYRRGFDNLLRVLKTEGTLYLSVPIGPQRVEFNAHRVFSVRFLCELFAERLCVKRFSFVDDRGDLHDDVELTAADIADNFGCHYGCGIFELVRER